MKMSSGNVLTALVDLFLPRLCCVCGGELGRNERYICLNCLADMPLTLNWLVRRNPMAERFNALIARHDVQETEVCSSDVANELISPEPVGIETISPEFDASTEDCFSKYVDAIALFDFIKGGGYRKDGECGNRGGYRNITYRLKYSRDVHEGRFFAAMLGERAVVADWLSDVDTVVPVPLHWTRRLRRGYNQAEVIASEVAKALGARLRTDVLERRRRTSTQTKLGIEEKARNVRGAFAVSRKFRRRFHKPETADGASSSGKISGERNPVTVRHILLVDDVFTTGSTLYNCWRPLHDFFGPSVRISIATLGVV